MHIAPYFLRLTFPGNVLEDDASSALYDPASGYLTVTLTKEMPGQEFPDLDLLAKLLAPRSSKDKPPQGPLIEVLSSEEIADAEQDELARRTSDLDLGLEPTEEQREILEGMSVRELHRTLADRNNSCRK